MPPREPGTLAKDLTQLLEAWQKLAASAEGAVWVTPPARGHARQVVGDEYPYKADFNDPSRRKVT